MRNLISARVAGNVLLLAFGLLAIFHVLILVGVAPANIVWGGQVGDSPANLLGLETIALVVTVFFAMIVAIKMGYIPAGRLTRTVPIGLWLIFVYLLLNTVGNLASGVTAEKLIFTPITVILALCALRLALEPTPTVRG